MIELERFQVEQTLEIIKNKLITDTNSSELEYYKMLLVELMEKLKE